MKIFFSLSLLLALSFSSFAQKEFVGVATYKMAMVGGPDEDSCLVVFDKQRILVRVYVNKNSNTGKRDELNMISDFSTRKQFILNAVNHTYQVDSLITREAYEFIDTKKIMLVNGGVCFHYKADPETLNKSKMSASDCLCSSDYMNESIKKFWFFGVQPIIVDSKVVMDFIVTEPDGSKPRVYVSNIEARKNVSEYFDLSKYKEDN